MFILHITDADNAIYFTTQCASYDEAVATFQRVSEPGDKMSVIDNF